MWKRRSRPPATRRPTSLTNVFLDATAPDHLTDPSGRYLELRGSRDVTRWRSNASAWSVQGKREETGSRYRTPEAPINASPAHLDGDIAASLLIDPTTKESHSHRPENKGRRLDIKVLMQCTYPPPPFCRPVPVQRSKLNNHVLLQRIVLRFRDRSSKRILSRRVSVCVKGPAGA